MRNNSSCCVGSRRCSPTGSRPTNGPWIVSWGQSRLCSGSRSQPLSAPSGSTWSFRRGFFRPKTPATWSASRKATPTSPFRPWWSISARSPRSCAPTRALLTSTPPSVPAGQTRSATAAVCWWRSSRAKSATACRRSLHGCVRMRTSCRECRSFSSRSRTSIWAGGWTRANINTHCSPTTPKTSTASRHNCGTKLHKFRDCSTSRRIST